MQKAFEFLSERSTQKDLGRRLAEFISANGTAENIDAQWLSGSEAGRDGDVARWLWIGRELGSLGRVDKVAIIAVVGDRVLDEKVVDLLCSAGRYDCVLTSDANAALLRRRLLSAPTGWYPANSGKEPLFLLPMFLSQPTAFGMDHAIYKYNRYSEVLERFREARSNRTPDLSFAFDFSRQAFELSCKIADLIDGGGLRQVGSLHWEGIVEEYRQVQGDCPAILLAANQISHMRRGKGARLKPANLMSRDRSIFDRIRMAKAQANNANWWHEQLVEVDDAADRFLFHLIFWTWATPKLVFEMADDIAVSLEEMPREEWSTLARFLPYALEHPYFGVARGAREAQPLPRRLRSRRFAFLVGAKVPATYGRAVFLDYFRTDRGEPNADVAAFRQFWALEAALAGALPWQSALSIIRSTYRQGASHYLMGFLFREGITLPDSAVDTILAQARQYPVPIWELAEGVASARARKAIRAVGKVAKEERWFAN